LPLQYTTAMGDLAAVERERDEWIAKYHKLDQDYLTFQQESAEVDKLLEDELEAEKKLTQAANKEVEKLRHALESAHQEVLAAQRSARMTVELQEKIEQLEAEVIEQKHAHRALEIINDKLEMQLRASQDQRAAQAARLEELEETVIIQRHGMEAGRSQLLDESTRLKLQLKEIQEEMKARQHQQQQQQQQQVPSITSDQPSPLSEPSPVNSELTALQERVHELEAILGTERDRIRDLESKLAEELAERAAVEAQLREANERVQSEQQERASIENDLLNLQHLMSKKQQKFNEQKAEWEAKSQEWEETKKKLAEQQGNVETSRIEADQTKYAELEQQLNEEKEERGALENDLLNVQRLMAKKQQKFNQLKAEWEEQRQQWEEERKTLLEQRVLADTSPIFDLPKSRKESKDAEEEDSISNSSSSSTSSSQCEELLSEARRRTEELEAQLQKHTQRIQVMRRVWKCLWCVCGLVVTARFGMRWIGS